MRLASKFRASKRLDVFGDRRVRDIGEDMAQAGVQIEALRLGGLKQRVRIGARVSAVGGVGEYLGLSRRDLVGHERPPERPGKQYLVWGASYARTARRKSVGPGRHISTQFVGTGQ